jgi:hypothetical protein
VDYSENSGSGIAELRTSSSAQRKKVVVAELRNSVSALQKNNGGGIADYKIFESCGPAGGGITISK